MIINTTQKNRIAEKILKKILASKSFKESNQLITIQNYNNGREQGYSIQNSIAKIVFSEHRNTDQIRIIFGKIENFTSSLISPIQGIDWENVPSEDIYKNNSVTFNPKEINLAIHFITQKLNLI
jgi:hypothetical protein